MNRNKFGNLSMYCVRCAHTTVDYLAIAVGRDWVGGGAVVWGGGMVGEGWWILSLHCLLSLHHRIVVYQRST